MDAKSWKIVLKSRLYDLESLLKKQATARNVYRDSVAKLLSQSAVYAEEYIEAKLAELRQELDAIHAKGREEANVLIEKLVSEMEARHAEPVDLTDPALTNLMSIINLAGTQLPHEEVTKAVETFVGNPASLKVLAALFEAKDMPYALEKTREKLYFPGDVQKVLMTQADDSFRFDGSLNAMATKLAQIAAREGVEYGDRLPDPVGADNVMRQAAGLPIV